MTKERTGPYGDGYMQSDIEGILARLPEYEAAFEELRETFLTNLIMIGEIPAPTGGEGARADFLSNRLSEYNLQNCSKDEKGNALGVIPGNSRDNNILAVAHLDTLFSSQVDHTINVDPGGVIGPGIGDNSLGLAVLASLPPILERLNIQFDSNLILMGSTKSLEGGNIEGLRFFLNNFKKTISAGICLEGVKLGRLSYSSIGILRGEIRYAVPEEYDWTRFSSAGAIVNMTELINRILEIPTPHKPKTDIVLGAIESGTTYNTIPTKATLKFEIRSDSEEMVETLAKKIHSLTDEMTSMTGAIVDFKEMARRRTGGLNFSHPMNTTIRSIMKALDVVPRLHPSTSELSAFIDQEIPAVTIGISNGEHLGEKDERIFIDPIKKGVAQFIGLLQAIDKGVCCGT